MTTEGNVRDTRWTFERIAALAFLAVGLAIAAVPFFWTLEPPPVEQIPDTADIEIETIAPGDHIVVGWRDLPVIVRRRTGDEIEASRAVPLEVLPDRFARNERLPADAPATDDNRSLAGQPQWLVLIGVNPRSGCRVQVLGPADRFNDEAFICPCDASRFDAAGRLRAGPAGSNLRVPPARLVNPHRLRIGR